MIPKSELSVNTFLISVIFLLIIIDIFLFTFLTKFDYVLDNKITRTTKLKVMSFHLEVFHLLCLRKTVPGKIIPAPVGLVLG